MKEVKSLKPSPQPNASWAFEVEKLNASYTNNLNF